MCSSGSKTKTSTSSTSALPQYANAYSSILNQAQNVASTPWNPATAQSVAGFSAPQTQAFDATQANLGAYQPYLGQASSSLSQGMLTPGAIQSFMNPYTQNVVDATQAQFANQNAQQAQSLNANAAKIGALTGDRSQVAQGVLAGQQQMAQAPVIAGLYNQGYQTAAQTAGQAAGLANQNAALASSIGGQAQQYGTNDIASLLGIGGLQQTQQQNVLNANTANAQAQSQYPFATTQWLSSLATGLGGAAGSQGSQTTPGPNLWSQLAGLGLGAASLFNRGGRVGYDSGGTVLPYASAPSYVPSSGMPHGGMNHPGSMPSLGDNTQSSGMSDVLNNFKQAHSAFQGLGNLGSKAWNYANTTTDPVSGFSTTVTPSGMSGFGNYLGNMFGFSDGGTVRRGYEQGGDVTDLVDDGTGTFAPSGLMNAGVGLSGSLPAPQNDDIPFGAFNQPSPIGTEDNRWAASVDPAPALAAPSYVGAPAPAEAVYAPSQPVATGYTLPESKGLFGLSLSDPVRQGLLAAGLGMMASESPWIGTAIGEGGLQGVKTYGQSKQQAIENAQTKTRIAQEAERLSLAAKEAAERMRINSAQEARAAEEFPLEKQAKELAIKTAQAGKWEAVGTDEFGRTKYAFVNPLNQTVNTAPGASVNAGAPENSALGPNGAALQGDDYLKTLPANEATMVKKMVNGEIPPPSSFVLAKSPYWNALMMKAAQYDPDFDQTSWAARSAGRKDFYGGGKSSEMVRAANQTIDHVGHLVESFDKLSNTQYPLYNEAKNFVGQKITGEAGVPDFLANAHAVADEMSKVFKGSNLSDTEIRAWEHSLNANMSPEQQRSAVAKLMDLLGGSLNALEQKRESSLGPALSKKMGPLLNDHSRAVLDRVKKWTDGGAFEAAPQKVQGRVGNEPGDGAVAHLRAHPDLAKAFDEKFGPGAAARALGAQ
jgi:hypothetical protein